MRRSTLAILLATIGLTIYLFIQVPKGFFPEQDNGRINGSIVADQDTSFQALDKVLLRTIGVIKADAGVADALGFTGGANQARMFISLKPLSDRKATAQQIIARLRPKLSKVPGAQYYSAGRAGRPHRRETEQRRVSVHNAGRQSSGPCHLFAQNAAEDEVDPHYRRYEYGPARTRVCRRW